MINALNKPSDEKNYADAAAQFAYRAYGFSGDQYNYIVSSIDKQFYVNFITFSFYRISLPSGILEIIVRLVLNRKISETIIDMISAVRKAHHTA